jgi:drug/metabolite transporter (DMT)-like permease
MVVLVGLQPIIANSRPTEFDAYLFAAMTCIVESIIFLPIMIIERRKLKIAKNNNPEKIIEIESLLNGWKKHKTIIIYIGINFGIAQILFFLGYQFAGAINGSLAQKTTVIFSLLFGYLINKEQISKSQIIFSMILLFGLVIAITQGSFNLLEFNLGVLILLIVSTIWMLAHALTKPVFDKKEATPIQFVFLRNFISGIILFSTYFLFFPLENINLLFNSLNIFYYVSMGAVYGFDLFCWYKVLSYIDVSKASVLAAPTPIVTAFFAIFLGEIFTFFHLIGLIIIIISIYFIVREKKG